MKYSKVSLSHFFFGFLGLVIIAYILYNSIAEMVINDSIDHAEITIEQSADYLELYVDKLKTVTNDLANNPIIVDYFSNRSDLSNQKNEEIISQLINTSIKSDPSLLSIVLISKDAKVISNETSLDMKISEDMMKEEWYQKAIHNKMPILTSARMQSFNMDKDNWVISISQEIVDSENNNLGVVVLDIPYTNIEAYLTRISDISNDSLTFIINSHNDLVYHPDISMFENKSEISKLVKIMEKGNFYQEADNILYTTYNIDNTDWTMVSVSELSMLNLVRNQISKTILIGFGILFIGIVITGVLLRNLTKSIVDKEQKIKKYELNSLYSQINPHFLYNTLDTIVWMAEFNESSEVVETSKSLASFFRLSLNNGEMITSLENELNHVKQYLIIQKKRYQAKLNYKIDSDLKLNDFEIPKLILQPIVENSIYHGIKELDRNGNIYIKVRQEKNDIIIVIEDDGVGFDASKINTSSNKLGGIGLKNVDDRIKLYYGKKYGLTIDSEINKGTCVTIRLNKKIINS